ncbi:uncharacterized protein EDB91DRAFT_1248721 [Suillus paluster]|uniref:uncharacterized protein n=1 Tax=Suillus paluster TaxID=48578 RepID=UPI001B87AB86|nr:uncharacterized protein EDB91DRAFT_1248721 [Suillus paluster]KAG1739959.1 hypothetical protein EDB91DRAFT_1248721 [Suillus paluster]
MCATVQQTTEVGIIMVTTLSSSMASAMNTPTFFSAQPPSYLGDVAHQHELPLWWLHYELQVGAHLCLGLSVILIGYEPCALRNAELVCMTMVRSLGEEYNHFASSLMLLKSLDKEELKSAFLAEELQRKFHPEGPTGDSALFTSSGECRCGTNITCYFCEKAGHCTHKCNALKRAKDNAKSGNGQGPLKMPRTSQSSLEMQVFALLTLPIPYVLSKSMRRLTGMQTQVPLLI